VGVHRDLHDEDRQRSLGRHVVPERESDERVGVERACPQPGDELRHHEPDDQQDGGEPDVVSPVSLFLRFAQIGHA
jgi:hypothetical protein